VSAALPKPDFHRQHLEVPYFLAAFTTLTGGGC
jgi:hypothetical protein